MINLVSKLKTGSSIRLYLGCSFGSYYKLINLFKNIQNTPSSKQKAKIFQNFQSNLPVEQKQDLSKLIQMITLKPVYRITTKAIIEYYLKTRGSSINNQINLGELPIIVCQENVESQLSIYDVYIFLIYLNLMKGTNSQKDKCQKILLFLQKVSIIEGIFLLKIIDKKLTIGMGTKLFNSLLVKNKPNGQ